MLEHTKKAIVVLSGGMDSTTLLYRLLYEGYGEVRAISFDYGQRHKIELERARQTCEALGVKHEVIDISTLMKFISNSALTNPDIDVPEGHYEDNSMQSTVVPNRNMIMASIAIGYAVNIEADVVALGVHAGDHAIYPDCRPEFIACLNAISHIANYRPIQIYTPYLDYDKGDIILDGKKLLVDYSLTHTCYKGNKKACGKCGSCEERLEAFEKAGIKDPIAYEESN